MNRRGRARRLQLRARYDGARPRPGKAGDRRRKAAREIAPRIAAGETRRGGVRARALGASRTRRSALADRIVTFPVNPAFASLNLAQAVLIIAYEWFKLASGGELPFAMPQQSTPRRKEQLFAFFDDLERELERVEFFRPAEKRETMTINLRNIFTRMQPTQQDIQTLHGVIMAIAEGRKGPARGGMLDGREAGMLREILAEHGAAASRTSAGRCAAVAAAAPQSDRRRARAVGGADQGPPLRRPGFKRQVPVGPHITDSCRSRCARSSTSCRRRKAKRPRRRAPTSTPGSPSAAIGVLPVRITDIEADAARCWPAAMQPQPLIRIFADPAFDSPRRCWRRPECRSAPRRSYTGLTIRQFGAETMVFGRRMNLCVDRASHLPPQPRQDRIGVVLRPKN